MFRKLLLVLAFTGLLTSLSLAQTHTPSPSPTDTETPTPSPTDTASPTPSPTASPTPSPTASPSPTPRDGLGGGPKPATITAVFNGEAITDEGFTLSSGATIQIYLVPWLATTAERLDTLIANENVWLLISTWTDGGDTGVDIFAESIQWKFFDGEHATPGDFLDGSTEALSGMPYRGLWPPMAIRVRGKYLDIYNDSDLTLTVRLNKLY